MKAKFNVMDFVIVVAVVLVVAAASYFFVSSTGASTGSGSGGKNVTASIEIEFANKDEYLTELPQVGDSVTIGEKEKMLATVTEVRVEPAMTIAYNLNEGSASWQEIPGKYDIYVMMEADAVDEGDQITINGGSIRVGDPNAVHTMNWAGYGYVTQLEINE